MKRFVIFLGIALAVTIHAGWMKSYGGNKNECAWWVALTSDGGYILGGATESSGSGKSDGWLVKTDTQGEIEWSYTYGDAEDDWINGVIQTSDGGYVATGGRDAVDLGDYSYSGDLWVLRVDSQGTLLWERTYGGTVDDRGECIQSTPDGGYIICGYKDANTSVCPWLGLMWLLKIDSLGDTLWTKTWGDSTGHQVAHHVDVADDGGYILIGDSKYRDVLLLKTNGSGDSVWASNFGQDSLVDQGFCVEQNSDGSYIAVGLKAYYEGDDFGWDVWLINVNQSGDSTWSRTFHQGNASVGLHTSQTSDGGYIIAGEGNMSFSNPNSGDLYLIKTDDQGNEEWSRIYGDNYIDAGHCVWETSDGGFIVSGLTHLSMWNSDAWLIKTDEYGMVDVSEESVIDMKQDWQLISSIGSRIVLRYENRPNGFHAQVFDASGRKVDEIHADGVSGTITWGEGYGCYGCYGQGVYFIKPVSTDNVKAQKVIIVQ